MSLPLQGDVGAALDPKDVENYAWGVSAVGSARHWQCRGQGFKSPTLQIIKTSGKR